MSTSVLVGRAPIIHLCSRLVAWMGFAMANPFPGMDPYLEGDIWMSVHTDLCAEIARQLAPKVRPKYVVLSTRRVVLAPPDRTEESASHHFPDVGILATTPSTATPPGVATAPLILPAVLPEPIPHVSVEIRDVAERRLVACIEVLSASLAARGEMSSDRPSRDRDDRT